MRSTELLSILNDEQSGLFFLAGLDGTDGGKQELTLHTAGRNFSSLNERFLREKLSEIKSDIALSVRHHTSEALFAPKSVEQFINMFPHEEIVGDPTGAFARAGSLLRLAISLRSKFGSQAGQLLWQNDNGILYVVPNTGPELMEADAPTMKAQADAIARGMCATLLDRQLAMVLKGILVVDKVPAGSYTPVDAKSVSTRAVRGRMLKIAAAVSGIASAIGIGSVSLAAAHVPAMDQTVDSMPGIAALNGLTSLGENSLGQRNSYQSIGGLRLYFGNPDPELMAACGLGKTYPGSCFLDNYWGSGADSEKGSAPASSRSTYGT
ncbi:MAG: hypothetical protein KDJ29_08300 [Hyphomicrobiales bacterium]|nr:hypothetical protein [Nitratireductor sp.]MCC2096879.1 hypothetical protein [Hyphomicrobiales bacterium]